MVILVRGCHQDHLKIASRRILSADIGSTNIGKLDFRQENLSWNERLGRVGASELQFRQRRQHLHWNRIGALIGVGARQPDLVGNVWHENKLELSTSRRKTSRRSGRHVDGELSVCAGPIHTILCDGVQWNRFQQRFHGMWSITFGQINADCGVGIGHAAGIRKLSHGLGNAARTSIKRL